MKRQPSKSQAAKSMPKATKPKRTTFLKPDEALRESEARFRALFENSLDAILLTAPDGGILSANPAACEMFGRTEAELCRLGRNSVVDISDPRLPAALDERLRTGRFRGELTFLRKDGSKFPGEISSVIFQDREGHDRTSMVIRDISSQKQAEEKIREREASLREAERLAHIGDWQWDAAIDAVKWSEELYRINRYDPNLPPPCFAEMSPCFTPESWERLNAAVMNALRTGEPYELDLDLVRLDGSIRKTISRGEVDHDASGNIKGLHGTVQDITERKQAEEQLRISEARYRSLIQSQSDLIARSDLSGHLTFINDAYCREFGMSREDLIGRPFTEMVYPEDLPAVLAAQDALMLHPHRTQTEWRNITAKGVRWYSWYNTTVVDDSGKIIELQGVGRDTTERKQAEAALRESEARYRMLFNTARDAIFMMEEERFISCNQAAIQMFGCVDEHDMLERTPWDFSPARQPDGQPSKRKAMSFIRSSLDGNPLTFYWQHSKKDGSLFDAEVSLNGVVIQEKPFLQAIVRDITERKRVEEALRESELRHREVFENSLDCIFLLDVTGDGHFKFVEFNPAEEKAVGLSNATVAGKLIEDAIPKELAEQVIANYRRCVEDETIINYEEELDLPIGVRYFNTVLIPVRNTDGTIYRIVGIARDITDQKQSVKALRESHAQLQTLSRRLVEVQEEERRLIGRELHDEIGQALTALKIILEMAPRLPPEIASAKFQQAQSLLGELIDRVSRLTLDLRPPMLDDLGLLPALLWHFESFTRQTDIRVDFKHSGVEGKRFAREIETAGYRIVQESLTNIARHAVVKQASVRLTVDRGMMKIGITDRGDGFDVERALAAGGGLSGMRERLRLLGGGFTVESAPGKGTRLEAKIPLKEETVKDER